MAALADIRTAHKKAGAMHALLAPSAFVNDSTVLAKSGDVFTTLRLTGKDPECLEEAEIADVVLRFSAAIRTLGPEYRVYQYLVKQHSPEIPDDQTADEIQHRRLEFLKGRARNLYSVRLYLVVLRMRQITDTGALELLNRFSVRHELRVAMSDLRRQADALSIAVRSLQVQLKDVLSPVILGRAEVLAFLRSLVNCTPWKSAVVGSVEDSDVDRQMAQSGLECWRTHLEQDRYRIKVLSLVELPAQTFPHMLRGLLALPCNATICTQWKREPNQVTRKEIDQKRRHYHLGKSSLLSYFGNANPRPDEVLIDDSKSAVVEALNGALTEMEMNENYFGRFGLTITLYDEDQSVLNRAAAKAAEVFATHDARLIDETYNLLYAWLSQVPGNYAYAHRWLWVLNTNYADMSFLFSPAGGDPWNRHLQGPALNTVESEDSTPYFLNLHYQDVGHTLILGSIGSGKSFLTNFLTASYQKYSPYTLIFDLGGSYRSLTGHYGGSYQHVGQANAFTINPCALPPTAENQEFLFQFVRVLIERDGYGMTAEEREDLTRCIADLYELDPLQRRLATLARTCKRSYRNRLAEWSGDGRLARYFDNETDNLSLARFQTFDFESMDQADVLEAMLFYILHRAKPSHFCAGRGRYPEVRGVRRSMAVLPASGHPGSHPRRAEDLEKTECGDAAGDAIGRRPGAQRIAAGDCGKRLHAVLPRQSRHGSRLLPGDLPSQLGGGGARDAAPAEAAVSAEAARWGEGSESTRG